MNLSVDTRGADAALFSLAKGGEKAMLGITTGLFTVPPTGGIPTWSATIGPVAGALALLALVTALPILIATWRERHHHG